MPNISLVNLSIVIPALNEHDRLGPTLRHIADHLDVLKVEDILVHEVIVVDDGSTDDTTMIAQTFRGLPMHVITFPMNKGKGAASRAGVQLATGDAVLIYDADAATPITEVIKLKHALIQDGSDIAIGSRVKGKGSLVSMSFHRRIIGRVYHFFCSRLVPGIHDTACGCKLFRTQAARMLFERQRIDRFAFDVEVLALALRMNMMISEVPVNWTAIPESKVRIVRDGLQMLLSVLRLYLALFIPQRKNT